MSILFSLVMLFSCSEVNKLDSSDCKVDKFPLEIWIKGFDSLQVEKVFAFKYKNSKISDSISSKHHNNSCITLPNNSGKEHYLTFEEQFSSSDTIDIHIGNEVFKISNIEFGLVAEYLPNNTTEKIGGQRPN